MTIALTALAQRGPGARRSAPVAEAGGPADVGQEVVGAAPVRSRRQRPRTCPAQSASVPLLVIDSVARCGHGRRRATGRYPSTRTQASLSAISRHAEAFFMPDSALLPPHPLPTLNVRRAGAEDRPVLERMWLLFRHDLSRFTGDLPRADGTFRSERLDAALTDPGWAAFLACCEDAPAGLRLRTQPGAPAVHPQQLLRRGRGARDWREFRLGPPGGDHVPRDVGGGVPRGQQRRRALLAEGGGSPQPGLDRGTPRRARPPAPASRLVDNLRGAWTGA